MLMDQTLKLRGRDCLIEGKNKVLLCFIYKEYIFYMKIQERKKRKHREVKKNR